MSRTSSASSCSDAMASAFRASVVPKLPGLGQQAQPGLLAFFDLQPLAQADHGQGIAQAEDLSRAVWSFAVPANSASG